MKSYTLWSHSVWGNPEDGFEVNDRDAFSRNIQLSDEPTDEQIINALVDCGYLKNIASAGMFEIDGDGHSIYLEEIKDGFPLCSLVCNED